MEGVMLKKLGSGGVRGLTTLEIGVLGNLVAQKGSAI
jgi:hypothetical protein